MSSFRSLAGFLLFAVLLPAAAAPALAADNASFVSQSVPTTLNAGQSTTVSVTMKNTGTTTWTQAAGYKLGTQNPQDNTLWTGGTRIYLTSSDSIAPNQSKTFTFTITAPTTPGTYNFQWRMVHEGIQWFGAYSTNVAIQVVSVPQDDADFISQSVPTTLNTGQSTSVSITMKNTGSATWTRAAGYKLGTQNPQDNTLWTGSSRVLLSSSDAIATGQSKTFTFTITAPTTPGTYNFQWRMVHEGVRWFGSYTTNVSIQVVNQLAVCPGVTTVIDGSTNNATAIQQCINNTASGGTLEIPAATYTIGSQVTITKPMTLRTQGTSGSTASCEGGVSCAVLKAKSNLFAFGGLLKISSTHDVTVEHLVIDGNRSARLSSSAASQCTGGSTRYGYNAQVSSCSYCRFRYDVSKNTLCGTSLEWVGSNATIVGNTFRANGQNAVNMMWADGLTALHVDYGTITDNLFVDNSDVALVVGGAINGYIARNTIQQSTQVAFAGLMLDNFNGSQPGDFTGAVVTQNSVSCTAQHYCHFGINLGPHPWYLSSNILGGSVYGNTVSSARQGINVDGAGTVSNPLVLYNNTATGSPSSATFNCGTRQTSNLNIYTGDSVVNRNGDTATATNRQWHLCP